MPLLNFASSAISINTKTMVRLSFLFFFASFLSEVATAQTRFTYTLSYSANKFDKVNSPVYYVCSAFSASTCAADGGSYSGDVDDHDDVYNGIVDSDTVLYLFDADSNNRMLSYNDNYIGCGSGSKISNYSPPSCMRVYLQMGCFDITSCSATVNVQFQGFATPSASPSKAPSGPTAVPSTPPALLASEKDALMAIYNSMGGKNWNYKRRWGSTNPINTWFGVTVDADNRVTELDLSYNNLKGSFSPEISVFRKLTKLIFDANSITGKIGSEIGLLTELRVISIAFNSLSGVIPTDISKLVNLEYMFLGDNIWTGLIPVGLSNLVHLQYIYLGDSMVSGPIPTEISNLVNLQYIYLGNSILSGPIPKEISKLINLQFLYLYSNNHNGSIPSEISTIVDLHRLELDDNFLTSSIPSQISKLVNLEYLLLSYNSLSSALPKEMSTLLNLQILYLFGNALSGSITVVSALTNLQIVYIGSNYFTGFLPPQLSTLVNLQVLYLNDNLFSGPLPPQLSALVNLFGLGLLTNYLTGRLIPQLSHLVNLQELDLNDNSFTKGIPTYLSTLTNLKYLHLHFNRLTGRVPTHLSKLISLENLYLHENRFTGTLSSEIFKLVHIQDLFLDGNLLTGSIPRQISICTTLSALYLAENRFTNTIPNEISKLIRLKELFLEENSFFGVIPTGISKLVNLQYLHAQGNKLTGSIPSQISKLTALINLYLGHNSLSFLPKELSNLVSLDALGLSNNTFSSSIPSSLCSLPSASSIDFRGNNFLCYPSCFRKAQWYLDPLLPHCSNSEQDQGICSLSDAFDMPTIMNNLEFASPSDIIFESTHPRVQYSEIQSYNIEVSSPDVFAYDISFDLNTNTDSYDYIRVCSDSSCSNVYATYGVDKTLFPGLLGNSNLRITSSSVYIEAGFLQLWAVASYGFKIVITSYTHGVGWSCTKDSNGKYFAKGLCESGVEWTGVECIPNSVVTGLSLSALGIKGTIPSYITNLLYLSKLDLSFNELAGSIPAEMTRLVNLKYLDISSNELSGILIDFSFFSKIAFISLRNNFLRGSISDNVLKISSLRTLRLGDNNFQGVLSDSFCNYDNSTLSLAISDNRDLCYPSCWISTHPSDENPEACNSNNAGSDVSSLSSSTPVIIGSAVGILALIISIAIYMIYFKRRELELKDEVKQKRLMELPIHRIVFLGRNYSGEELNEVIMSNLNTVRALDADGNSVMDLILDTPHAMKLVDVHSLYKIALLGLPFDPRTGEDVISNDIGAESKGSKQVAYIWARLVQSEDPKAVEVVSQISNRWKKHVSMLANSEDKMGRKCIEIASLACKDVIKKKMYLFERYELLRLEHDSHTSVVWIGIDHGVADSDPNRHVALKFMKEKGLFEAELNKRSIYLFSPDHVVNIIKSFNGEGIVLEEEDEESREPEDAFYTSDLEAGIDTSPSKASQIQLVKYSRLPVSDNAKVFNKEEYESINFRRDAILKGFESYPFCAVMPNAGQSLQKLIFHQRTATTNWEEIKFIMKQLCMCVNHIHSKGVVHGDLKPLNILNKDMVVRLIDFDASVDLNKGDFVSPKFSTAFIPPEMFEDMTSSSTSTATVDAPGGNATLSRADAVTRASFYKTDSPFPYGFNRIKASHHIDMWSLGVILYILSTESLGLVQANRRDDIDNEEDMDKIRLWTNDFKNQKLSVVSDKYARNLLSILLSKEPSKRLNMRAVLNHPFITGNRATTRLRGDSPMFDVFLSYRVDSDQNHAEIVYNELVRRNLKVWWDKKSLPPGLNWEQGFCNGLFDSATFVCIISREAVNSSAEDKRNIAKHTAASACDNVMLEWRLATELEEMGMLNRIYPLLIGDKDPTTSEYSEYFKSGCAPTFKSDESVDSIEDKLKVHLEREGLGCPLTDKMTMKGLFKHVCDKQGCKVEMNYDDAIDKAGDAIETMVADARKKFI